MHAKRVVHYSSVYGIVISNFLGFLGFIWCIFWMLFAQDSFLNHRMISLKEKLYLSNQIKNNSINQSTVKLVRFKIKVGLFDRLLKSIEYFYNRNVSLF